MGKTIRNVPSFYAKDETKKRDGAVKGEICIDVLGGHYNSNETWWGRSSKAKLKKLATRSRRRHENEAVTFLMDD